MYLYTILTTCLFYTFGYTLCIWHNYLSYCGLVGLSVVAWIAALVVVVSVSIVVITCVRIGLEALTAQYGPVKTMVTTTKQG